MIGGMISLTYEGEKFDHKVPGRKQLRHESGSYKSTRRRVLMSSLGRSGMCNLSDRSHEQDQDNGMGLPREGDAGTDRLLSMHEDSSVPDYGHTLPKPNEDLEIKSQDLQSLDQVSAQDPSYKPCEPKQNGNQIG
jgi:hypothetical protein